MVSLIHNLKYQTYKTFCNGFINIICFLCMQWNFLYPYNTILVFHHFLVLCSHTRNLTLLFYSVLVLKVLNRQVYSWIFVFFLFLLLINFQKIMLLVLIKTIIFRKWCLVLITNSSFFFQLLQVWYLCLFSHFLWCF